MTEPFNHSTDPSIGNSIGSDPPGITLPPQASTLTNWQMFGLGAAAGGLLSFAGIALSIEMTQTAITDLSSVTVGIAIVIPLVFGTLGFKFKQPFLDALSTIMNTLPY